MNKEEQINFIYEEIAERINFDWLDWQSLVTWDLSPVFIWDVLDYIDRKTFREFLYSHLIEMWEEKRGPIEEQSDECVEFVYSIIKYNINWWYDLWLNTK